MDPKTKIAKIQAIVKRFSAKLAALDAKKNKVIISKQQTADARALAKAQDNLKNI